MSFMNIIARGNIKRIKEFHELGQRPDAIVTKFAESGINISLNFVICIISGEFEELDRIALPKQVVFDLEADIDEISHELLIA